MKNRLFCLGDSFAKWHLPKYHWTHYLSYHYDVINLGQPGADNYSILFQFGNLPDFQKGDRVVVVFTAPGRLPRRFYGNRTKEYENVIYHAAHFYKNKTLSRNLELIRFTEEQRWIDNEREIEIKFLKQLRKWLHKYNPVFTTWHKSFHEPTSDFVTYIDSSTNAQEGVADKEDFHPGPKGCYTWYETLHTLLNIKEEKVDFIVDDTPKNLL